MMIYCLSHPVTKEIRYVGATKDWVKRYTEHLKEKSDTYKCRWVQSILRQGMRPELSLLEETDEYNWQEREEYWIKDLKEKKYKLTNATDGGEGVINPSQETRIKRGLAISRANTGRRMEEWVKKKISKTVSRILIGHHVSKETRLKFSKAKLGIKLSPEHRNKIGDALRGKPGHPCSDETKNKLRIINLGKKHTEAAKLKCRYIFLGKKHSPETRQKISKALKASPSARLHIERLRQMKVGISRTEEAKLKMSLARKGKPWTQARRDASNNYYKTKFKPDDSMTSEV